MKNFKSTNERISELLKRNNVKEIFDSIQSQNDVCESLLEMVEKNSNDFTKDISKKGLEYIESNFTNRTTMKLLSVKQCWAIAYQIRNNINIYKLSHEK